jgi:hypothetical protein
MTLVIFINYSLNKAYKQIKYFLIVIFRYLQNENIKNNLNLKAFQRL